MGIEIFYIAVLILMGLAVMDLVVGVSNDAVNFLNSSLGSRVAPRYAIMIIASLGIIAGVTFSSGMMEIARKGIFHPQLFTMPELITIFLAVMLADVILLDLFNTFGLPTSTTVSIVFELLGAAVAVSVLKIMHMNHNLLELIQYINTAKAMLIIFGILMSIIVAFVCGAVVQFICRLIFTFDYLKGLNRYGAIWGGVAMASITYFILVKGAQGASFISPETVAQIKSDALTILLYIFAISVVVWQLLLLFRVNILKPIVLVGTFALAMAFAANDLVNFIGVPLAGMHSYEAALASNDPLNVTMVALSKQVQSETILLLIAGLIMVITLWFSKKARSVTETEIGLGQQEEGVERFDSVLLSRIIVRMVIGFFDGMRRVIPASIRSLIYNRLNPAKYEDITDEDDRPPFDLLRASVNLMVASAVVSYATSQTLPLSTTYVTFMVAMGTSFADQAWGRESAVYRVTGVLTVVGGWFMTAVMAFTISCMLAVIIFYTHAFGVVVLVLAAVSIIYRMHHKHKERVKIKEDYKIFNLKKIKDAPKAISTTFEHMSYLLREIRESLDAALEALFDQDEYRLREEKNKTKRIQLWVNIIIANIFKAMRLLQRSEAHISLKYAQTIRRLQKLADGHRDIVMRSYEHVSNHHKGLLDIQIRELKKVRQLLHDILLEVESTFDKRQTINYNSVIEKDKQLRKIAENLNQDQIERIRDGVSKTRLSILYYAIVGNAMMLSKQNLKLLEIFEESFGGMKNDLEFDLD
ncbi:MAG: anion permease [Candidatus Glassbacteria bacterium]